jgi:Tol biopolymer transport system component
MFYFFEFWNISRKILVIAFVLCMMATLVSCVWLSSDSSVPTSVLVPVFPESNQIDLPDQLKQVIDPDINSTGTEVVFVGKEKETESNLYAVNLDSSLVTPLLPKGSFYLLGHPRWSPDGKAISFSGDSYQDRKGGIWALWLGNNPIYITEGQDAVWSPDGSRLAVISSIASGQEIRITTIKAGQSKTIYHVDSESGRILSDLNWSPDGKTIVFVMAAPENSYLVSRLYLIDVNGDNLTRLSGDLQFVSGPKWIQEGEWIAFLMGSGLDRQINFVRADGKCLISPLEGSNNLFSVDFASDGKNAVATSGTSLYRLDIQSALAPRAITEVLVCP